MKFTNPYNSSSLLRIAFIIAIFILILVSSISYKHNNVLNESSNLVIHTYEINIELERLISSIKDAETGQRGFIISKDTTFLKPYVSSREKVNNSFQVLKNLTLDNPKQQQNLRKLFGFITLRFNYLEKVLYYNSPFTYNKKMIDNHFLRGKIIMESIRTQVDTMKLIEKAYLNKRQIQYENEISFTPFFTALLFLVSLTIILISYRKINGDIYKQKDINKQLMISTKLMDEAEKIGSFSTWKWDLTDEKITYSENHFRILGFEPHSFDLNDKNFVNFVHPEDKEFISQLIEKTKTEEKLPFVNYRIVLPSGEIRYLKSVGKLLVDENDKKLLLGITVDVTDEHFSNIAMYERNLELEKSNEELASFNHVASHDLQEPLRKIQTFISRISENDKALISENAKEYIKRIESSADRMRILIDDLLLFSKTNTNKKEFVEVDLNTLFENAKQELNETIIETNAKITASNLPTLSVIPYQIEQMFINLIGNSIKYKHLERNLEINVTCEIVTAAMFPEILPVTENKYFKIELSDNGMGFDPQFKNSIFVLFKRLHSKTDYPGTGIGLAICKKIVENHKGFISAEGQPEIGAKFTFFLPS